MKRGWIGFLLLVSLLAGGTLSAWDLSSQQEPLEKVLAEASQCALTDDWERALALAEQAEREWERRWRLTAVFSDHGPMEEIDGMLAQLEVYAQAQDPLSFAALCAELSREMAAVGDSHVPTWWNLL